MELVAEPLIAVGDLVFREFMEVITAEMELMFLVAMCQIV
jgi:hypothetical protein